MLERLYQAEWKPDSPDRFSEISELVNSVESLKLEEGKSQGKGSTQKKAAESIPTIQKELFYVIMIELLGGNPAGEMRKNALKNKKKREKKKAAKAAASGANNA